MFCPRCSHQQTSETARFCTKCGFQISAVKELIANDGVPVTPVDQNAVPVCDDLNRRIRRGSKIINIVLIVLVFSIFSDLHNGGNPLPKMIVAGVLMAIFAARMIARQKSSINFSTPQAATLPDTPVTPVTYQEQKRIVTAEIVPVPSVTEGTTKLLVNQPRNAE